MQYTVDKNTEMSEKEITQILQDFNLSELPKLQRYYSYYIGNQDILLKRMADPNKPCNKIVTNFCDNIVKNYQGYMVGNDIAYTADSDFEAIQEILDFNDVGCVDSELLGNALIFGRAYEICYLDEQAKQRFKVMDSRECIPVYARDLSDELLYMIRVYPVSRVNEKVEYAVDVYDAVRIRHFKCNETFSGLSYLGEDAHHYGEVPFSVFDLNKERVSIFEKVMTLQNAYNTLLSSETDDFEAFCDAYMILKGCTADEEDLKLMKENRILVLDAESSAEYLSKSISDTQIENMLSNIATNIHKISCSPDFSEESFGTSSGIAMKYKLLGFENVSGGIEKNMVKALQKRIELICSILGLTGSVGADLWRDVKIIFTRNLPVDNAESANLVNSLRGLVSDKTLLAQLKFVDDPALELARVAEQKEQNMITYGFGQTETEEVAEEEE